MVIFHSYVSSPEGKSNVCSHMVLTGSAGDRRIWSIRVGRLGRRWRRGARSDPKGTFLKSGWKWWKMYCFSICRSFNCHVNFSSPITYIYNYIYNISICLYRGFSSAMFDYQVPPIYCYFVMGKNMGFSITKSWWLNPNDLLTWPSLYVLRFQQF